MGANTRENGKRNGRTGQKETQGLETGVSVEMRRIQGGTAQCLGKHGGVGQGEAYGVRRSGIGRIREISV